MPARTPKNPQQPPARHRIDAYVDEELYEWVHRQAAAQERTTSSWLRFVLRRLREGLHDGTVGAMLEGGASDES